jgi:hypothetical protein
MEGSGGALKQHPLNTNKLLPFILLLGVHLSVHCVSFE